MIDELSELLEQATTEKSHYYVKSVCERTIKHIIELESKLAQAIETLEFYAERKTWLLHPSRDTAREIIAEDCNEVDGYAAYCGGKRAREVLAKLK